MSDVRGGSLFRRGRVVALVSDRTGPGARDMSYESGERSQVTLNRGWAAATVGAQADRQVWCRQVHAATVAHVREGDVGRADAVPIPGTDALVCDIPGVLCGVLAADCAPVLLAAPDGYAVVHVGWRGLVSGVVDEAMGVLLGVCGRDASEVTALIGPHIGPCCFEVGEEVAEGLAVIAGDAVSRGRRRPHVDLGRVIEVRLAASGVLDVVAPFGCTRCERGRWYSHRRGDSARHALVACLAPHAGGGDSRGRA